MQYFDFIRDFGPLAGVVLFFIWRDWKREENLSERVQALEKYQQETLVTLTKHTTEVIAANTHQLKWLIKVVSGKQAEKQNDQTEL